MRRPFDVNSIGVPSNGWRWGNWVLFSGEPPTLRFQFPGRRRYFHVPLREAAGPGFQRWVKHLEEKSWGRESLSDFLDAITEIRREGFMQGNKRGKL